VTALEALERLADARADVEAHDGELSPAPWHVYHRAAEALEALDASERAHMAAALDHERAGIRVEAALAIARLGLTDARDALARHVDDASARVRDECVVALARIAPATALSTVVEQGVRVSARALGAAVDAALETHGAAAFEAIVQSNADPWQVARAGWAKLYDLERAGCQRVFTERLRERDVDWVLGIAEIVRRKGGDWAREPFVMLAKNPDRRLHRAAAEALGGIGGPDELDALLDVLGSGDRWAMPAAMSAVFAIGARTRTAVAARAIAVAADDESAQAELVHHLVGAATLAWEAPSRPAILASVRRALQHAQENVVTGAVQVAIAMRAEELTTEVVQALGHPRWCHGDLWAACVAFVNTIGPSAVAEVARAVERGLSPEASAVEGAVASRASHTLGRLGTSARDHAPVLVRALRDGSDETRRGAAGSLGALGVADAADALLEMASTAPPGVAYSAVRALIELQDARVQRPALAYLAPFLDGAPIERAEEAWMCHSSLDALGASRGPASISALRRALAHHDMRMRRDASDALADAGDVAAIPWLEALAGDPDKQVREAAARARARLLSRRGGR
jgi:HEAT repeat protein